jgi:hypothetical protein
MCGGDCSDFAVSAVGCSESGTCAPLGFVPVKQVNRVNQYSK